MDDAMYQRMLDRKLRRELAAVRSGDLTAIDRMHELERERERMTREHFRQRALAKKGNAR